MTRNWGIPRKDGDAFDRARTEKPGLTMSATLIYGVIGAALAAVSFSEARDGIATLFRGRSLIAAVVAAGFGCWFYIWLARPRFAAHFTGRSDAFSQIVRFYARGAAAMIAVVAIGFLLRLVGLRVPSVLVLCASGGAAAAAAFQTVLAFVPYYDENGGKR